MTVWETTIRTGHPATDQQALDQLRRSYEPRGLTVHVQPLPQGGLHVRVAPPAAPPPYVPPGHHGHPAAAFAPAYAAPVNVGARPGGIEEDLGAQRVRYLRKVYGLLAVAAFFAIAAGWACVSPLAGVERVALENGKHVDVPLVVAVMLDNPPIQYGAFGALVVGIFLASLVSKVRGLNYVALFGVSALMGVELAPMAFVAQVMAGMGATLSADPVQDAFVMVGAIFVALTAYVFIAKKDFSYLHATLSMGFVVVLAGCVMTFVFGSELFALAVASAGAVLSIGFLLYQTSWILKNSEMDDPIDDALGLIVQLRNLFMFLLRILMSSRR